MKDARHPLLLVACAYFFFSSAVLTLDTVTGWLGSSRKSSFVASVEALQDQSAPAWERWSAVQFIAQQVATTGLLFLSTAAIFMSSIRRSLYTSMLLLALPAWAILIAWTSYYCWSPDVDHDQSSRLLLMLGVIPTASMMLVAVLCLSRSRRLLTFQRLVAAYMVVQFLPLFVATLLEVTGLTRGSPGTGLGFDPSWLQSLLALIRRWSIPLLGLLAIVNFVWPQRLPLVVAVFLCAVCVELLYWIVLLIDGGIIGAALFILSGPLIHVLLCVYILAMHRRFVAFYNVDRDHCPNCDYSLEGMEPGFHRCPECGAAICGENLSGSSTIQSSW